MLLKVKPDLQLKVLKDCEQQLRITANEDLDEIKLDIAELYVTEVVSLSPLCRVESVEDKKEEDKLIIKLNRKLPKYATADFSIK